MTMRTPLLSSLLAFGLLLPPAGAQAQFSACLADLKASALERGIRAQTFERTMAGVEADPKVLEAMDIQPEFKTPIWDYLAGLVDQDKIKDGLERLKTYAAPLAAAESKYGVDRHAILAVWGVETDYGNNFGKWPLPQSLSTISCSQSVFITSISLLITNISRNYNIGCCNKPYAVNVAACSCEAVDVCLPNTHYRNSKVCCFLFIAKSRYQTDSSITAPTAHF